jgi:hypothetical protein
MAMTIECQCADCQRRRALRRSLPKSDPIVDAIVQRFNERSKAGIEHYGCTMADNMAPTLEWVQHAQEELMDAILYLERLKTDLEKM